jgi:hypothetical protein
MCFTDLQLNLAAEWRFLLGYGASEIDICDLEKWFYNGRSRQLVDIGIHAEKEVIQ